MNGGGGGGSSTPAIVAPWAFAGDDFQPFTLGGANQIQIEGFIIPNSLTFTKITVSIHTADAVNSYDLGIYTQAGVLVADIGAQTLPSTGIRTFATVQGSKTLTAGLYLFGWTGNAATAALGGTLQGHAWILNGNVATSAGGALPASIAAQVVTPGSTTVWFELS